MWRQSFLYKPWKRREKQWREGQHPDLAYLDRKRGNASSSLDDTNQCQPSLPSQPYSHPSLSFLPASFGSPFTQSLNVAKHGIPNLTGAPAFLAPIKNSLTPLKSTSLALPPSCPLFLTLSSSSTKLLPLALFLCTNCSYRIISHSFFRAVNRNKGLLEG